MRKGNERRSGKALLIAGISVLAVALVVFLGVFAWGVSLKNRETAFPNVCVAGVNIGGMTSEEAVEAVQTSLATTHATRTLTVQLPDRKLVFDPELANTPMDVNSMVAEAMAYGRDGSAFAVLKRYLACKDSAYILDMEKFIQVDEAYIRELIEKTAVDIARDMTQSEITMDEENAVITIQLGYNGRKLNTEKLAEKVLAAYDSGDLSERSGKDGSISRERIGSCDHEYQSAEDDGEDQSSEPDEPDPGLGHILPFGKTDKRFSFFHLIILLYYEISISYFLENENQ